MLKDFVSFCELQTALWLRCTAKYPWLSVSQVLQIPSAQQCQGICGNSPRIIEYPSWKGPISIIKSNSWLCAGHPMSHTMCLRPLSEHFLSSGRISAVTTFPVSSLSETCIFATESAHSWLNEKLCKSHKVSI